MPFITGIDVSNLQPGDFACVDTAGPVGSLIKIGQWLNGDGFSEFQHAILYVGDGKIVQAEPGGAQHIGLRGYGHILWSSGLIPLTDIQREQIVSAALGYVGTPYGWGDYFALAAHRLHLANSNALRDFIASSDHMICSQLVDQCYVDAGVHLFTDNRWPGYVTPAALANRIRSSHA